MPTKPKKQSEGYGVCYGFVPSPGAAFLLELAAVIGIFGCQARAAAHSMAQPCSVRLLTTPICPQKISGFAKSSHPLPCRLADTIPTGSSPQLRLHHPKKGSLGGQNLGPRGDQHRRGWHASSPSFCQCLGGGTQPPRHQPPWRSRPIKAGAGTIAPWKPRDVEHLQTIEPSAPGLWGSCKICFHLRRPGPRRRVSPVPCGAFLGFVLASSTPCMRTRCRADARTPPKRLGNTQGKKGRGRQCAPGGLGPRVAAKNRSSLLQHQPVELGELSLSSQEASWLGL